MHFHAIALLAVTGLSAVVANPGPVANPAPTPLAKAPGYPVYARSFYQKRQDEGEGTGEEGADGGETGGDGSGEGESDAEGTCKSYLPVNSC